ncbi:MAG: hypothetical protein V9F04_05460 [Dermatophilaceae bacterium]
MLTLPKVEAQMAHHRENRVRWVEHLDPGTFRMDLDRKRERFLRRFHASRTGAAGRWPTGGPSKR